jgi:hypothetical protein
MIFLKVHNCCQSATSVILVHRHQETYQRNCCNLYVLST